MAPSTHLVTLPGLILERGFWLYVLRAETLHGEFLYVGRTGDNSSPFATQPYQRMGQHLGHQRTVNMLRRYLEARDIRPEHCKALHMVSYGPIFPETIGKDMALHKPVRDIMAALEKALAEALSEAGYNVFNTVRSRKPLDTERWGVVREAFAEYFPRLNTGAN